MKWLVRTIPGLAVPVAVALAIGFELPAQLRIERSGAKGARAAGRSARMETLDRLEAAH
jgi:hypothetical protein